MNEFFSWEFLLTFAGCMFATGIITEFLKGWLDRLIHIPTRLLAWVVALVVLIAAQGFTGALTPAMAFLDVLNAIIIASSTSGTIDGAKDTRRVGK